MYALACAGALVLGAVSLDAEDISAIDKNFRVATVGKLQVNYFDALKKPFELTGFAWRREGEPLYRIPKNFTEKRSTEVCCRLQDTLPAERSVSRRTPRI